MNKINISAANLKLPAIVILSILAALLLIKILLMSGIRVGPAPPVEISVNPPSQAVEKGKEFIIDISVDPANNPVTAAQFSLLFNSSVIEIKNVTGGGLLKQNGAKVLFDPGVINNSRGALINTWGIITTPGANVTEKGIFVVITLVAKNRGKGELRLSGVILSGPEGTMINTRVINGSVDVKWEASRFLPTNLSVRCVCRIDYTPPAGVRSLRSTTYAQRYFNWTWTDPTDADFSKVMVYLNGFFSTNISRGVRTYNVTGLTPGFKYTLSTRTVDIAGNNNMNWVNHSARTKY